MSRKIKTQANMVRAKVEKKSISRLRNNYTKEKTCGGDEFFLKTKQYEPPLGWAHATMVREFLDKTLLP